MENKNYNHCYEFCCLGNGINTYLIQLYGNYGEDEFDVFVIETLKKLNKKDIIGLLNNYNNKIAHNDKDIKFYSGNGFGYYFTKKHGVYVAEWMSNDGIMEIINKVKDGGFEFMCDYVLDIAEKVEEKKVEIIGCNCRVCKEFNNWAIPDGVVGDGKYTCWNCANSYHRIIRGLDMDKLDSQVAMIKKNYKMGV